MASILYCQLDYQSRSSVYSIPPQLLPVVQFWYIFDELLYLPIVYTEKHLDGQ